MIFIIIVRLEISGSGGYDNGMLLDKKRRLSDAKKWYFRLMNDPEQYEKETFVDRINEINMAHLFRAKVFKDLMVK